MNAPPAAGALRKVPGGAAIRVPAGILLVVTIAALLGPSLSAHDYFSMNLLERLDTG
jgi:hypothetical protein